MRVMKKNDTVKIYDNPEDQTGFEGEAILISKINDWPDIGCERWRVKFVESNIVTTRIIKAKCH